MLNAFLIGLLATSSLVLGGIIAIRFSLSNRAIGMILGFGAGTLISAVSYELIFEAVKMSVGSGYTAYGFFAGAATFFLADKLIGNLGNKNNNKDVHSNSSSLIIPMVLAIILDGIPESIVIGLGIFEGGKVSMAMLVAVFISNLPEAIAGSKGMKEGGWSKKKILFLWLFISLFCALSTVAGFSLFSGASNEWLSFIQAFAGGAILMMLANSMIPESYEHGGKLAGVFTVLGFFVSVSIIVFENLH
ncbi:ZIP family metal transporter [Flavobacterium sp. RSB2_4_14]|uniref:ZIP family metal transporter n=1 Tax=Flavobacterium sp. RSB2_4_14 TaxID=3447665 RepID=UPI003F343E5C